MRLLRALLTMALLPLLTRAAFHSNDTACTRHYTVVSGDTCDRIGQKTLTSTYQILAFNLLDAGADCYTLEIGQRLCLGRYGNDCQFVHQCTDQDTCESIANAYGITTEVLQNNNPSLDCNVVYDGLMLCVSAGIIRPPAERSINATEAKVAREMARQAYIAQEKAKKPQAEVQATSNKHSSHKKQHKQHRQHKASAHPHHSSSKGGKAAEQPAHSQHLAKEQSDVPQPSAEQASSQSTEHHDKADSSPRGQNGDAQREKESEPISQSGSKDSSSPSDHHIKDAFVEDLLSASTATSNYTPQHHADKLATGATNSPQRRHRSLSSRSHHQHQRSYTP